MTKTIIKIEIESGEVDCDNCEYLAGNSFAWYCIIFGKLRKSSGWIKRSEKCLEAQLERKALPGDRA